MPAFLRSHAAVFVLAALITALAPAAAFIAEKTSVPAAATKTPTPVATTCPVVLSLAQPTTDASKSTEKPTAGTLYTTFSTAMWALMWIALALIARGIVHDLAEMPGGRRL